MSYSKVLGLTEVNMGSEYTDDEREFLAAVDHFKRRTGRRFPTLTELLGVLKSLGYAKKTDWPPAAHRCQRPSWRKGRKES